MRKTTRLMIIFVFVTLLSGCWGQKEVEERSYTITIGLDLPENIDIEEKQAVDVTFQFSNPKLNIKGASGEKNEPIKNIITITAPDLVTAKNMANSTITRQISFSHMKAIIVSEELAKTDFFYRFLSSAVKEREVRRETSIIVTEGKASEFIKDNDPELNIRPHKYYQFIIDRSIETGLVPEATINRLLAITDGDADLFLSIYGSVNKKKDKKGFKEEDQYLAGDVPKEGGNPVQLMGSAVFKEGKMIAKLTGEETRGVLLLDNTSKVKDMFVSFPDPLDKKFKIGLRVKKKTATEVKIKRRNGPPKIDAKVPLEIELLSVPSMENYSEDKGKQKILEQTIENEIEKNLNALVEKSQSEFKSDPFYWSLYARPLFSTVKEYENWDWTNKNYPFADIDLTVDVVITGFGKQLKESEMEKVKD